MICLAMLFSGCNKKSGEVNATSADKTQAQLEEQQVKIDELQKFKDEQIRIKEEEKLEEEKQKILSEQNKNKNAERDKCNDRKHTCENKISKIKNINYQGEQIHVSTIDESSKQIKYLKKLLGQWDGDKKTCDSGGSATQLKECEDMVDKRISEGEDDIKKIEELTEKAKKEISKITNSEECKNYEKSCE